MENEQRTVMITVRVSTNDVTRLDTIARKTFRTRSDVVRLLLAQAEARGWDLALKQPPAEENA